MKMTSNFFQLDYLTTISPLKHFQKHIRAQMNKETDTLDFILFTHYPKILDIKIYQIINPKTVITKIRIKFF